MIAMHLIAPIATVCHIQHTQVKYVINSRWDDKLNKHCSLLVILCISLYAALLVVSSPFKSLDASASESIGSPSEVMQSQSPNSTTSQSATDIFNSKSYVLPSSANNFVVLIPDEGHHGPGEADEARFIAQSFVPETTVINEGTNVIWFNSDVGHEHNIIVTNDAGSTSPIYQTGEFAEFKARNYTFNEAGAFRYADSVEYDNGYIMRGNISVTADQGNTELQHTTDASDTVGITMVPTQDISQYTADLQSRGFVIDSMHNFRDLRGGQSGTGDEQTLIVWRSPPGMQISSVLSQLAEFSSQLPYS